MTKREFLKALHRIRVQDLEARAHPLNDYDRDRSQHRLKLLDEVLTLALELDDIGSDA